MKNFKIEIKWGLIFVAMMLLWMLIEKLTGLHDAHIDKHAIFTNFIAIPAIVIFIFALLDKRKNFYGGVMTYKQGFISGLIITVIVALFSPLVQYIISAIISPNYFMNVINYTVAQGHLTRPEAEAYFNMQNYMIQGFIGSLIMGAVTSAVVAIFTRTKNVKD